MKLSIVSVSLLLFALHAWQPQAAAGVSVRVRALSRSADASLESAISRQLARLDGRVASGIVCRPDKSKCRKMKGLFKILRKFCLQMQCARSLIMQPSSSSRMVKGVTERRLVAAVARERGLPQAVAQKLQAAAFSRSVVFQTFTFVVDTRVGRGRFETFVGAARRLKDDDVEFGVVKGVATATLVRKTTQVRKKKCKRRFFIKRCRRRTVHVPRGNTAEEMRRIEMALRHYAVAAIRNRLTGRGRRRRDLSVGEQDLSVGEQDLSVGEVGHSDDVTVCSDSFAVCTREFLNAQQRRVNSVDPADSSNATTLVRMVRRGFDRMQKSSTTQRLQGISVSMATNFVSFVCRSLKLPTSLARPLQAAVVRELDGRPDDSRWKVLSALFTSTSTESPSTYPTLNCLVAFVRRRRDVFDFAYASTGVSLQLADDILLLQTPSVQEDHQDAGGYVKEDDDILIRMVPRSFTEDDVKQTMAMLKMEAARLLRDGLA